MTAREVYVDADEDLHTLFFTCIKNDVPVFKRLGDTNPSEIKTKCVIKTNPDLAKDIFTSSKNDCEWVKRPSNSYLSPNMFYLWRRDIASCIYDPMNCHSALKDYVTNKEPNKNEYLQNLLVKINDNIPYSTRSEDPSRFKARRDPDLLASKALGSLITRKFIYYIHKTEPSLAVFVYGANIIQKLYQIFAYLKRKSERNQGEWFNFKYLIEYLNVGFALLVENPQLLDKYTKSSEWWDRKSITEWLNNLKTVDEVIEQFLLEPISYRRYPKPSPVLFRLLPGETFVNLFLSFSSSEVHVDAETVNLFKEIVLGNKYKRTKREVVDFYKHIDRLSVDRFKINKDRDFNFLDLINKSRISKETWKSMNRLNLFKVENDGEALFLVGLELYKLDLSEFINCEHLKTLQISYEKLNGTSLALKGNFKALRDLDLSHNQLTQIQDAFDLPELARLDLSSNQLETINTAIFQKSEKLTWLGLNNNKLRTHSGNPFNFEHLPNLNCLDLSSNKLTRFNAESFINMDKAQKLESLYLQNNEITVFALDIEMEKLRTINLCKNPLNSTDFDGLRKFATGTVFRRTKNEKMLDFSSKKLFLGENAFSKDDRKKLIELQKDNEWKRYLILQDPKQLTDIGLIPSLSIEDDVTDFPHLRSLKWDWIPIFAVLTGKNGVGKTKLLKFIEKRLQEYYETKDEKKFARTIGLSIIPGSRLPAIFPLYLKLHDKIEITEWKDDMWQDNNPPRASSSNSLISLSSIDSTIDFLSDDLDQVNKHLSASEKFKHSIIENPAFGIKNPSNRFLFQSSSTTELGIPLEALSPGEHIILILLLWEYVFSKYNQSGQVILLLDEVDSHLHPSAVEKIIAILKKLAASGIQIIMTSHSPTTVAMVEKENLFHLCEKDDKGRLQVISYKNATNKHDLIRSLTDEVVRITERMRVVFTEGENQDDHFFYQWVKQKCDHVLSRFSSGNDSTDKRLAVIFRSAGGRAFAQLFHREKTKIENKQRQFNDEDLLFGIVDGDDQIVAAHVLFKTSEQKKVVLACREFTNNLFRLERYNLENYLYDPINFFFLGVFLCLWFDELKQNLKIEIEDEMQKLLATQQSEDSKKSLKILTDLKKDVENSLSEGKMDEESKKYLKKSGISNELMQEFANIPDIIRSRNKINEELVSILKYGKRPVESGADSESTLLKIVDAAKTGKSATPLDNFLEIDSSRSDFEVIKTEKQKILQQILDASYYLDTKIQQQVDRSSTWDKKWLSIYCVFALLIVFSFIYFREPLFWMTFPLFVLAAILCLSSPGGLVKLIKDWINKPKKNSVPNESTKEAYDNYLKLYCRNPGNMDKRVDVEIILDSKNSMTLEYHHFLLYFSAKKWGTVLPDCFAKGAKYFVKHIDAINSNNQEYPGSLNPIVRVLEHSGFILTIELLEMMETLSSSNLSKKSKLIKAFEQTYQQAVDKLNQGQGAGHKLNNNQVKKLNDQSLDDFHEYCKLYRIREGHGAEYEGQNNQKNGKNQRKHVQQSNKIQATAKPAEEKVSQGEIDTLLKELEHEVWFERRQVSARFEELRRKL